MRRSAEMIILGIGSVLFTWVLAGCRSPALQVRESGKSDGRKGGEPVDLAPYLAQPVPATQTYVQSDPQDPADPPNRYDVINAAAGRVGGSLVGCFAWPLAPYFDRDSNRPNRPRIAWPIGEQRAVEAFLIEFNPPVAEWPAVIRPGEVVESAARMRAYDRWGIPFADGSARRWVRFGGFEDVEAGGLSFADCVRLEADTNLWFGWWAFVRLRETAWFARGLGLVRRTERINGSALLIFRFNSVHEYELRDASAMPVAHSAGPRATLSGKAGNGPTRELPGRWVRLAICMDKGTPHPRVGGLAVEWSDGLAKGGK